MSLRCPSCLHVVPTGVRICPRCGTDFHATPTAPLLPDGEPTLPAARQAALDFVPGHFFAGRYTIIEKAGAGGMGIVYKAIDNSLGRVVVALKLIRPEWAASPSYLARFRREVRLVREVTHPNICRVHDLGECDGVLFLTMEWVDGESLRQLLHKTPVLQEGRALEVAGLIARGLAAAHGRGIVHRDLKPENVMIDEHGEVRVMDFGLAVRQGDEEPTGSRAPVGTRLYMSPEQKRGEALDARSDLYTLGLLLREMLTGEPPADGAHHRTRRGAGGTVSRAVGQLLDSLLEKDRDRRCRSAEEAAEAIRRLGRQSAAPWRPGWLGHASWAATIILLLAGLLAYIWLRERQPSPAEALYRYGLEHREDAENERTLDDAVHMFRRAVEADPNYAAAWAGLGEAYWKRYGWTRQASSREEAVAAVEKAFQLDPDLAEAHYARASGLFAEGDIQGAHAELEIAVKERPDLDAAWALLGRVHGSLGDYQGGRASLDKALALRPGSFRHHLALGLFFDKAGEYDDAAKAYRKATELKPESTMSWNSLGTAYLRIHSYSDAVTAFQRSIDIEERGANRSNLGTAFYYLKNYEAAAESHRAATRLEPKRWVHWGNLGDSLRMLGRQAEAREAYHRAIELARERTAQSPGDAGARSLLGLYCARAQDNGCDALAEGDKAESIQPSDAEILFRNAIIRSLLGQEQRALDWLEKAVRFGLSRAEIENDPDLPALRRNPRYLRILELAS